MQLTDIQPSSYTLKFKNGSENIIAVITNNDCWELTLPYKKGVILVSTLVTIFETIFDLDKLKDIPCVKMYLKNKTALIVYRDDDITQRLIGQITIDL